MPHIGFATVNASHPGLTVSRFTMPTLDIASSLESLLGPGRVSTAADTWSTELAAPKTSEVIALRQKSTLVPAEVTRVKLAGEQLAPMEPMIVRWQAGQREASMDLTLPVSSGSQAA